MVLPLIAAGGAIASGIGSFLSSKAQARSAANALKEQRRIYDENVQRFQPTIDIGNNALADLSVAYGQGTPEQSQGYIREFQNSPNYLLNFQTGLNAGTNAINSGNAARGVANSGATLKALSRFGTDYNNNYLSQYMAGQEGLANKGLASTSALAGVSQNFGNNAANLIQQRGAAQAAGFQGLGNTVNNALGAYSYGNAMNQFGGQQGSSGFGSPDFARLY